LSSSGRIRTPPDAAGARIHLVGPVAVETGRARQTVGFTVKTGERLLPQMLESRLRDRRRRVGVVAAARKPASARVSISSDGEMPASSAGRVDRPGCSATARIWKRICEHWLRRRSHLARVSSAPVRASQAVRAAGASANTRSDARVASIAADEIVGRLVSTLKTPHSAVRPVTVILLADLAKDSAIHGEQEHGLFVYDEAIRVPPHHQTGRTPGREPAGGGTLVQHIDLCRRFSTS